MKPIKVTNERTGGNLFHYAHFICDCLYPEFLSGVFDYTDVFRLKSIHQTLGNFASFYEEISGSKNHELALESFESLDYDHVICQRKEDENDLANFESFRDFIFNRLDVKALIDEMNKLYCSAPEILLIKRGEPTELISDEELKLENPNQTNGKERREILGIDKVEEKLKNIYGSRMRSVVLEEMPFRMQVFLFNQAKFIICAHGACMSNLFFCESGTKILEVQAQTAQDRAIGAGHYPFFDYISKTLDLDQHKIKNNPFLIIKEAQKIH
jgi:hypothetical protein|tara:strand:+ start:3634 stop:4443 length:810 start_codon:yes stop_codon:yes gene_type:complete